jgi:hypothetical protein
MEAPHLHGVGGRDIHKYAVLSKYIKIFFVLGVYMILDVLFV